MPNSFDNDVFLEFFKKWPAEAFRYLHKYYYQRLVHIAQQRTNDKQASEDVVQEVFIDVWKKIGRLTRQEGFLIAPYLLMLVKKKSITAYRRSIAKEKPFRDSFEELISKLPSAEDNLVASDIRQRLRNFVKKLPHRERECIELRYFEGMSNDAIADRLGVAKKTVEKRLTSGKKMLRARKDIIN